MSESRLVRFPNGFTAHWLRVVFRSSETRHAQRFLSSRPNKTDRSDARGIAEMMGLGHYRSVHAQSKASQLLRTTLIARKKFVDQMLTIEDTIRGLMKVHGLKLGAVHRSRFAARVETLLADTPDLRMAIEPLLEASNMMRQHKALMDRQLSQLGSQRWCLQAVDDHIRCRTARELIVQGDD